MNRRKLEALRNQCVFRCGGSFRGCVCRLPPIVQVDGNWYCRVHDPAARAKRATALSEKWVAERKAQKRERSIHEAERRVIEAAKEWAAQKNGKALISCDDMPLVKAVRALQEAERV